MLIHCGSILVIEGKKLGSLLLEEVENDAKSKGAKLIHLDTFDFQAKELDNSESWDDAGNGI